MPISGLVLLSSELPRELRVAGPGARAARDPRGLRQGADRLGDAPRAPAARRPRPDPGRRPAHPAPPGPEAARGRGRPPPDARLACPVDRRGLLETPRLVIGAGLDRGVTLAEFGAARRVARRGLRALRRALALRPGRRREQLPAGRRLDPRLPRDEPALDAAVAGSAFDGAVERSLVSCRPARRVSPGRRGRIRLEAQDTALSRRRSPVRIRYAVPTPYYIWWSRIAVATRCCGFAWYRSLEEVSASTSNSAPRVTPRRKSGLACSLILR